MFEDADRYNRGAITYEALKDQLEKHGGLLENLSIRYIYNIHCLAYLKRDVNLSIFSIDRWLVPVPIGPPKTLSLLDRLPHQFTAPYIKNNYVFLSFLAVYIAINVGLFVSRAIQYSDRNGLVMLARACGGLYLNTSSYVFAS